MKRAIVFAVLAGACLAAGGSLAAEDDIKLAAGAGLDVVEANCSGCHSIDYIQMNSPFLDEAGWKGVVTKMVNAFGAPISEGDQTAIVAYLSAHYAK